jgi:hypothetical protein
MLLRMYWTIDLKIYIDEEHHLYNYRFFNRRRLIQLTVRKANV